MSSDDFKRSSTINKEIIIDIEVPSYAAFEQYLCDVDIGIFKDSFNKSEEKDCSFYILIVRLAMRFGSIHLVEHYFRKIKNMMSSSTCIDVLEVAIQSSFVPSIVESLDFITQSNEVFVQSTCFMSKQKKLQDCINKDLASFFQTKK